MSPLLSFALFGTHHLLSLGAIALFFLVVCSIFRCATKDGLLRQAVLACLVSMCFLCWPIGWAAYLQTGYIRLDNIIPFHLCNIAAVLAGFALLTRHHLLCELTFYWGLAGTLQALITPAVEYDYPHPVAFQFFYSHGLIVCVAFLLPLGLGWRPRLPIRKTVHRAFLWINLYTLLAFSLNFVLPTNFGYFRAKPDSASLLDLFGPWPYYILVMEVLAYGLFWLFSVPFLIERSLRKNSA